MAKEYNLRAKFSIDINEAKKNINKLNTETKKLIKDLKNINVKNITFDSFDKGKRTIKGATSSVQNFNREIKESVKSIKELQSIQGKKIKAPKIDQPKTPKGKPGLNEAAGAVITAKMATSIAKGMLGLAKNAISTSAQISTAGNTMHIVFGEASNDMERFINTNAKMLGMSSRAAKQMATGYGIMLKDVGLSIKQTEKLTERLMRASSILAEKTGYDMETVTDSIKSGLMGNTMSMDKLGIELKESALQTTEAFKQISKGAKFRELSYETQSLIRAMVILEKTTKAYGDEIGTSANAKLLQMRANLKDAKDGILEMMGTALKPLTGMLATISESISLVVNTLKQLNPETQKILVLGFSVIALIPVAIAGITAIGKILRWLGISANLSMILTVSSLAFVVAGIAALAQAFGGLKNVVDNIGTAIVASITYMAGAILYTIGALIGIFTGGNNAIKSFGQKMIDSASGMAKSITRTSGALKDQKGASDVQKKALDNSTKANNKNAKSADKAAKANKSLKDNLQGFDEINKLTPDEAGGSGDFTPNVDVGGVDLSGIEGSIKNLNSPLKKLKENIDKVKAKLKAWLPVITAIGTAIVALKIGGLIAKLFSLGKAFNGVEIASKLAGNSIFSTGINIAKTIPVIVSSLMILSGSLISFKGAIEGVKQNNAGLEAGFAFLGTTLTAVGAILLATTAGLTTIGIAASGVGGAIIGLGASWIGHNIAVSNAKNEMMNVEEATRILQSATDSFNQSVNANISAVDRAEKTLEALQKAELASGISGAQLEEQVKSGTLSYEKMTAEQREVYKAYKQNEGAQIEVKKTQETLKKSTDELAKAKVEEKLRTHYAAGEWNEYKKTLIDALKEGTIETSEFQDKMALACSQISEDNRKTFLEDIPNNIREGIDPNKYDSRSFTDHFKSITDTICGFFKDAFNKIKQWWNGLSFNKNVNVNANTSGGARGGKRVPAMATGGVVSGATLALVGEGKYDEAVVPLGQSPQFRSMKEDIAEAVLKAFPEGQGNNNGGIHKIEIDILAGGKLMQKKYINMLREMEAYS